MKLISCKCCGKGIELTHCAKCYMKANSDSIQALFERTPYEPLKTELMQFKFKIDDMIIALNKLLKPKEAIDKVEDVF